MKLLLYKDYLFSCDFGQDFPVKIQLFLFEAYFFS